MAGSYKHFYSQATAQYGLDVSNSKPTLASWLHVSWEAFCHLLL